MKKTCANLPCSAEFEPHHHLQIYCCAKCRNACLKRRLYSKDAALREEMALRNKIWRAENPEKNRMRAAKSKGTNYRRGKLPKWMFS